MKKILLILCISLSGIALTSAQSAWKAKLAPKVLIALSEGGELDLMVEFTDKADLSAALSLGTKSAKGKYVYESLKATAQESQARVLAWAAKHHLQARSFYIVNAIQIKIPAEYLEKLASFNEVKYITSNGMMKYHEPVEQYPSVLRGPAGIEWGLDTINANEVWALGYRGQGVVVAGEDTDMTGSILPYSQNTADGMVPVPTITTTGMMPSMKSTRLTETQ